eukprot:sb/3468177/
MYDVRSDKFLRHDVHNGELRDEMEQSSHGSSAQRKPRGDKSQLRLRKTLPSRAATASTWFAHAAREPCWFWYAHHAVTSYITHSARQQLQVTTLLGIPISLYTLKSDFLKLSSPWVAHDFYLRVGILFLLSHFCFSANLVKTCDLVKPKFYELPKLCSFRATKQKVGDNFKKSESKEVIRNTKLHKPSETCLFSDEGHCFRVALLVLMRNPPRRFFQHLPNLANAASPNNNGIRQRFSTGAIIIWVPRSDFTGARYQKSLLRPTFFKRL